MNERLPEESNYEKEVHMIKLTGHIDSNNAAQFEKEIMDAVADTPDNEIILDAENLEYISSAGLRVLMKLRKQTKAAIPLINVSPDVYEIFEVTGFTELFNVQKRLREVSIEGCSQLGSGANGTVYRLTKDEMIKVFRPGITLDEIEAEREASRKTFLLGVPCAIAFDTVKVGDCYGTIYEMLNAATVQERIREKPDRLPELAAATAKLLKELHETEVPDGQMLPADRLFHSTIDKISEDFTPDEIEKLHELYHSIPTMNRFVHNDYHAKNVMETGDGELMLIDLGDAGAGNPVIDLIHCCFVYQLMGSGAKEHTDDEMSFIGLTYGELKVFWKVFLETYCGSVEKAEALNEKLMPFATMQYLTVAMSHPRLPKEYHPVYADKVRKQVLSRYDELLVGLDRVMEDFAQ